MKPLTLLAAHFIASQALDLSRTTVSRQSDKLILSMKLALTPFVIIWTNHGKFTAAEMAQLKALFLKYAGKQYLLGLSVTKSKHNGAGDQFHIETLATAALDAFLASLHKQDSKVLPFLAGITATVLSISALNRGTTTRTARVRFVTRRDERVCKICEGYDGNEYDVTPTGIIINGPLIPVHIHCRCRYMPA